MTKDPSLDLPVLMTPAHVAAISECLPYAQRLLDEGRVAAALQDLLKRYIAALKK